MMLGIEKELRDLIRKKKETARRQAIDDCSERSQEGVVGQKNPEIMIVDRRQST